MTAEKLPDRIYVGSVLLVPHTIPTPQTIEYVRGTMYEAKITELAETAGHYREALIENAHLRTRVNYLSKLVADFTEHYK